MAKRSVKTGDQKLARRRERLRRERGPLPDEELHRWHVIDGPGEDWQTSVMFVIREGRPVIGQLRVTPYRSSQWSEAMDIPEQGLTSSDLRKISLRWNDEVHELVAEIWADVGYEVAVGRRAPKKYEHKSDDDYAEKALEYLRALREDPQRPLAWLEGQYRANGQYVTRAWLRDWVHGARKRGFLTRGNQGTAGGSATEKLDEWVKTNAVNATATPDTVRVVTSIPAPKVTATDATSRRKEKRR